MNSFMDCLLSQLQHAPTVRTVVASPFLHIVVLSIFSSYPRQRTV